MTRHKVQGTPAFEAAAFVLALGGRVLMTTPDSDSAVRARNSLPGADAALVLISRADQAPEVLEEVVRKRFPDHKRIDLP